MIFTSSDLSTARDRGYSDDEIWSKLSDADASFSTIKERGYSLDEVAQKYDSVKTKGGEKYGKEDQSQADSNGYAPRPSDKQGEVGVGEGPLPGEVRLQKPEGSKERQRGIYPGESRSYVPEDVKGGELVEKDAEAKSKRAQERKEDGQGLRGEVPAWDEEEVSAGGVRPPAGSFVSRLGKSIVEKPGASAIAGLGSLAETAVELGGGALAAAAAVPVAALAGVPTGGVGGLAVEFGAFAAGSALTKNLLIKPVEKALGLKDTLEEAQQEAPEVSQVASLISMLPFAAKSALGYAETAAKGAVEEAVAKGAAADLTGAAAKAVGKKALGAAIGGAAFEPIRYGAEKALQKAGIGEEPAPVTAESVLESAGQMAVLGGVGHDIIASAGLPRTAEVASRLKSPEMMRKLEQTRLESADPHDEVEEAYRLAEDHIKVGNRAEASDALTYAKDLEKDYPVDKDTQQNRNARFAHLDSLIEKIAPSDVSNPLPPRRKLPSEIEGERPPTEVPTGEPPPKEEPAEPQLVSHKVVSRQEGKKTVFDVVEVKRDAAGAETEGDVVASGLSRSKANLERIQADKRAKVGVPRPEKYDPFGTEEMPISNYIIENIGKMESRSVAESRAKREGRDLGGLYDAVKQAGRRFFADPTHNKVFGGREKPDNVLQALIDAGLMREDATVDDLWDALSKESYASKRRQEQFKQKRTAEEAQQRQMRKESRQEIREGKRRLKELEKKTDERSITVAKKLREQIAAAEAELKPQKPSEKRKKPETGPLPSVEREPVEPKAKDEAEGGAPSGLGKGKEEEVETKGTKPLSAAYRRPSDGKIFYAKDHISAMREAGVKEEHIPKERTGREDSRFGFRTDTHEFVTRDEAEAVARKHGHLVDEEGFNASIAEDSNHKLHSNDVRLENHAEYENPLISEEKLGPGASKKKELEIKKNKDNFVRAASLHQTNPELSNNYLKWWSEFKRRLPAADRREANKLSQDERHALFEEGKALLDYSNASGKGLGFAVEDSKNWWNKSKEQIVKKEAKRDVSPVRLDFDTMNENLKKLGFEPLEKGEAVKDKEVYDEAVRRMSDPENPDYTINLIESLKNNFRPVDSVEKMVLALERLRLDNHINDLYLEAKKQPDEFKRLNLRLRAEQIEEEALKLSELYRRSVSEGARSLRISQTFLGQDMSFIGIKRSIEAILGKEISAKMKEKYQGIASRYKELGNDLLKASQRARDFRYQSSASEILKAAAKEEKEAKGKSERTPQQEIRAMTARVKGAKGDPMELGQAIRGLFKALHKADKSATVKEITESANAIIKKYMGKDWDIEETKKAIGASGQYHQGSLESALTKVQSLPKMVKAVFDELQRSKSIENPDIRKKRVADILKKNNISVENAHADLKEHFNSTLSEVQKLISEMEHQQRECI